MSGPGASGEFDDGSPLLLGSILELFDRLWPQEWAQSWDAVGLTVGDPGAPIRRILLAVDVVPDVVAEARAWGADLLLTHHPLLLRGVHSIATTTPKGRMLADLVAGETALFTAHTNADTAPGGVNDALAAALDLQDTVPLLPGIGGSGMGRVGRLTAAVPLATFVDQLVDALPVAPAGVRVAGWLDSPVQRVAVCSGAGDDVFDAVREADVDVYVTADLRHHPASEALAHGRPALIDAGHFATEWPWLPVAAAQIEAGVSALGTSVETRVSTICTDPWTALVLP